MGEVTQYERARQEVAAAATVDEAQAIKNKADAMKAYALQANDIELSVWVSEIALRARIRLGEISSSLPPSPRGGTGGTSKDPDGGKVATLKAAGVSKSAANRYEKLAEVPKAVVEAAIASCKASKEMIKISDVLGHVKKTKREEDLQAQRAAIREGIIDVEAGPFNVIVIDPPWPYGTKYDPKGRRVANPYPEMPLEDIAALDLEAESDCVLWLWTTHKFMRHSFPLLDAWGFEDKAILTWVKDRMGTGQWLRSQSEFCIMAVRGKPVIDLTNQTTVLQAPLREHSRKPDEFYSMVEGLCLGTKVDWFSRETREGWAQRGNDTGKFDG